eukprot:3909414-Pyramimonas_sp.AAC.1
MSADAADSEWESNQRRLGRAYGTRSSFWEGGILLSAAGSEDPGQRAGCGCGFSAGGSPSDPRTTPPCGCSATRPRMRGR